MFDPSPNEIPEDPATGSAAGPLAAYTAHWRSRTGQRLVIEQGIEMGRASLISVIAEHNGDAFTRIMVGGTGVIVGHGEVYWE